MIKFNCVTNKNCCIIHILSPPFLFLFFYDKAFSYSLSSKLHFDGPFSIVYSTFRLLNSCYTVNHNYIADTEI